MVEFKAQFGRKRGGEIDSRSLDLVNSCWGDYWSSLRLGNSSSIRDQTV